MEQIPVWGHLIGYSEKKQSIALLLKILRPLAPRVHTAPAPNIEHILLCACMLSHFSCVNREQRLVGRSLCKRGEDAQEADVGQGQPSCSEATHLPVVFPSHPTASFDDKYLVAV